MLQTFAKRLGALLMGCAIGSAGLAHAQTEGYVAPPSAIPPAAVAPSVLSSGPCANGADCAPGVWFNVDYLLWAMKSAPAPGALATTALPGSPRPGVIGAPGTRVLIGNDSFESNPFSGVRLEAGTWIDEARSIGFEASVFTFEHKTDVETAVGVGNAIIARPYFNTQTRQETARLSSLPGVLMGGVIVGYSTRFTGWDFNVDFNAFDDGVLRGDVLVGVRGAYLNEALTIHENVDALVNLPNGGLNAGQRGGAQDRFGAQNNFLGGQLGGRLTYVRTNWIVTGYAKVAVGVNGELIALSGQSITSDPTTNVGGGFLSNAGNDGRYFTQQFAVIPELGLNLGYRITNYMSVRAGYSMLYWSNVSRASQNVTHAVSPALIPSSTGFGTGSIVEPRAQIQHSDFWAQGLNFGVEFRF